MTKTENRAKKIAVIGDVHGCYDQLQRLYDRIACHTDEVYTVGDLIDRGPDSMKVLQFCIDNNIKPVLGNHEDMLLKVIENPVAEILKGYETYLSQWLWNGGEDTIASYTGSYKTSFRKFNEKFVELGHYEFIKNLPLIIELDGCIITHGGIVEFEPDEDVLWNREEPMILKKLQVIGHTPNREVVHVPNHYINVDSGCVFWGDLSGVLLEGNKVTVLRSR